MTSGDAPPSVSWSTKLMDAFKSPKHEAMGFMLVAGHRLLCLDAHSSCTNPIAISLIVLTLFVYNERIWRRLSLIMSSCRM